MAKPWRIAVLLAPLAALVAALVGGALTLPGPRHGHAAGRNSRPADERAPSARAGRPGRGAQALAGAPGRAVAAHRLVLGHSVDGRPIEAVELGDRRRPTALLVVGCVHGDECAGRSIARRLERREALGSAHAWVIEDLNPDGYAAHTRQNARGVDLNRNFPWRWRTLGPPGATQYAGGGPLSEPESRLAYRLILRARPRVAIWFHQPLGLVDESGGDTALERRFAHLAELPVRRLPRYPGSAVGWQDHRLPGTTAFAVELPPGRVTGRRAAQLAAAVRALVQPLAGG